MEIVLGSHEGPKISGESAAASKLAYHLEAVNIHSPCARMNCSQISLNRKLSRLLFRLRTTSIWPRKYSPCLIRCALKIFKSAGDSLCISVSHQWLYQLSRCSILRAREMAHSNCSYVLKGTIWPHCSNGDHSLRYLFPCIVALCQLIKLIFRYILIQLMSRGGQ